MVQDHLVGQIMLSVLFVVGSLVPSTMPGT
jgi:hypothetical protein